MKYKIFGKNSGLFASEMVLGAAMLGTRGGYGASPDEATKILQAYTEAGGNFIDTSDRYQLGESEELVGKFIEHQRNNFILSTKYTQSHQANPAISNFGNHRKAMRQAVDSSLKRLRTDYIDIYMPHYDDGISPIDEITRGLEDLVQAGKVLYIGLSNFPAWKAAAIATKSKLTAIQMEYNLTQRTADRDLVPMADHFGLGVMMYSPLAGGLLTGKYREGKTGRISMLNQNNQESDNVKAIIDKLQLLATEYEVSPGQIALAWILSKDSFPLIGARTIQQFNESLNAFSLHLSPADITALDTLSTVTFGYPHDLLAAVRKNR